MPYMLPELPYAADALEPFIDRDTMALHHGTHHAGYVDRLNAALEPYPELAAKPIEELLRHFDRIPTGVRPAVRRFGGGHANHSLFWQTMGPAGGGEPTGAFAGAVEYSFGTFAALRAEVTAAALARFGSGWVWVVDNGWELSVDSTANQDSPLLRGWSPVLCLDVWEHAYYLQYRSRRADYVSAWWNVVDWTAINRRWMQHGRASASRRPAEPSREGTIVTRQGATI